MLQPGRQQNLNLSPPHLGVRPGVGLSFPLARATSLYSCHRVYVCTIEKDAEACKLTVEESKITGP